LHVTWLCTDVDDLGASFLHITGKELVDGQDFFW
jgi:hypothetical protein